MEEAQQAGACESFGGFFQRWIYRPAGAGADFERLSHEQALPEHEEKAAEAV